MSTEVTVRLTFETDLSDAQAEGLMDRFYYFLDEVSPVSDLEVVDIHQF